MTWTVISCGQPSVPVVGVEIILFLVLHTSLGCDQSPLLQSCHVIVHNQVLWPVAWIDQRTVLRQFAILS